MRSSRPIRTIKPPMVVEQNTLSADTLSAFLNAIPVPAPNRKADIGIFRRSHPLVRMADAGAKSRVRRDFATDKQHRRLLAGKRRHRPTQEARTAHTRVAVEVGASRGTRHEQAFVSPTISPVEDCERHLKLTCATEMANAIRLQQCTHGVASDTMFGSDIDDLDALISTPCRRRRCQVENSCLHTIVRSESSRQMTTQTVEDANKRSRGDANDDIKRKSAFVKADLPCIPRFSVGNRQRLCKQELESRLEDGSGDAPEKSPTATFIWDWLPPLEDLRKYSRTTWGDYIVGVGDISSTFTKPTRRGGRPIARS